MVDAGPLHAYVDADDRHPPSVPVAARDARGPLVVPQLVVAEVVYLLATRLRPEAEVRFLGDLAGGAFVVEPVHPADWLRIAELVGRYRDLPLGTVDASVVAAAERLGIREVATLDRRYFTAVRPRHVEALRLLPELGG
jgi:predicted nucleic acid-binding protein